MLAHVRNALQRRRRVSLCECFLMFRWAFTAGEMSEAKTMGLASSPGSVTTDVPPPVTAAGAVSPVLPYEGVHTCQPSTAA
jgi:hypothetical protein